MTDRIKALVVTLEPDVRSDDAEAIIHAIRMMRRVASVDPLVDQIDDLTARRRVRHELADKLMQLYKDVLG